MLSDEDRTWLKQLDAELWPAPKTDADRDRLTIVLQAERLLGHGEVERIFAIVETAPLVTEMFSKGMFGGYGIALMEHELYPHTGPTRLLSIIEDHLPPPKGPTVYDHLLGTAKPTLKPKKHPGCGTDQAWELFSKYTHSPQNSEWLKQYKMRAPEERYHYDY